MWWRPRSPGADLLERRTGRVPTDTQRAARCFQEDERTYNVLTSTSSTSSSANSGGVRNDRANSPSWSGNFFQLSFLCNEKRNKKLSYC